MIKTKTDFCNAESGYCGYGPTYCGDGCTSNCDAHAECGQYSESGDKECPLNVCCSQHGFCGTTEGEHLPEPIAHVLVTIFFLTLSQSSVTINANLTASCIRIRLGVPRMARLCPEVSNNQSPSSVTQN